MCSNDAGELGLGGFEAESECLDPASGHSLLLTLVCLHDGLRLVIRESSVFARAAAFTLTALFFIP